MTALYADEFVTLYHADYRDHLEGLKADAIVTDPPYGETSLAWDRWPTGWLQDAAQVTDALWCFGSFRMFHENAAEFAEWKFSQDVIWQKHAGSSFVADRFKRVHEVAVLWYRGEWRDLRHETPRIATDGAGIARVVKRGVDRTVHTGSIGASVWEDDGTRLQQSVITVANERYRAVHPTQKPVGIVVPLIEYSVPVGGMVVDFFAGSGTTAIAARQSGRRCIAFEADRKSADAAARRLAQQTFVFEGVS